MTIAPNSDVRKIPVVSVVIPVYNAARYIGQALDSLHAQTFSDYEVIVVNDGSADRDELEQLLRSHPLSVVYLSQENKGVSAARNAGIRIAKGEFYAQLDADDQWTPDYLEVQLGLLSDNPDVALVYPNATIIGDDSDVRLEFMNVSPSRGEVNFESLVRQECTVMTCVTARISAIREVGMFDESLRTVEDFDLWLRIAQSGRRIIYHPRLLVLYRRHSGSLSSDRVRMLRNLLTVFEKTARNVDLTPTQKKMLHAEIVRNRAILQLFEGKRALSAGGARVALVNFKEANEHLHSRKLELVIFFLRHLPRLVIWSFGARQRLLARRPDHKITGIDQPHVTH